MAYINIISRSVWGYRFGLGWGRRPVPVKYVILHHSDTPAPPVNATLAQDSAAIRYLDEIGYNRFKASDAGYKRPEGAGISYTWAVPKSGRVFEGHDLKRNASHTQGYNTTGVGIVLIGDYEVDTPSAQQIEAVALLVLEAYESGWVQFPRVDYGHRDLSQTACPGKNVHPLIKKINARILEIQKGGTVVPVDPNKGFTIEYIKGVQSALRTLGYYEGAINGKLPDVDRAVRGFQVDNRLGVDGQPGDGTMGVIKTRLAEQIERLAREKAEQERLAREKAAAEALAKTRIAGSNRWNTAGAMALATLPSGKGVLIAADGSPDERYATARAGEGVIYLPVRQANDTPPGDTIVALRNYKPAWVRFVGGSDVVTDACARAVLEATGLL